MSLQSTSWLLLLAGFGLMTACPVAALTARAQQPAAADPPAAGSQAERTEDTDEQPLPAQSDQPDAAAPQTAAPAGEKPSGLVKLTKDYDLWVDLKRKIVVVDGQVCLREGQLEMFACPKGTKEHESIVSVNCKAQFIHAALLAVGAKPGTPVSFDPTYRPATGTEIEVLVLWKDHEGKKHQVRAQDWIRHVKTGKAMPYDWVFAGSGFWTDEQSGQRYYHGDAGDFICVSNFPTATLDLPVESSQANADLLFEAFTERIPPRGTEVRLVLRPKQPSPAPKSGEQKEESH